MKVLFGMADIVAPLVRATMSARQTTGFARSLLRLIGLDREVPDFSTLSRRQKTLAVNIPYDTRKCHDAIAERGGGPMPSFHLARTPGRGRRPRQAPSRATRPCGRRNTSAGCSGDEGADITAGAASRYEPGQKTIRGIVFPANGCTV